MIGKSPTWEAYGGNPSWATAEGAEERQLMVHKLVQGGRQHALAVCCSVRGGRTAALLHSRTASAALPRSMRRPPHVDKDPMLMWSPMLRSVLLLAAQIAAFA